MSPLLEHAMRWILSFALLASWASPSALAAERTLDQTSRFEFRHGKRVVVDVMDLDIEMRAADVTEIEVVTDLRISGVGAEKAERWVAGHTPEFVDSPDALTVISRPGKSGFLALGHLTARARIRLVVPNGAVPDITTTSGSISVRGDFPAADPLRLRSSSGSMDFVGATAGIDVRSASGDSHIEVLRPLDTLFARTSSGTVQLTGGARSTQVDTASGDIRLANLSGSAVVETSTGKITLLWDRLDPTHTVRARSSSGRVRLTIPETADPGGRLTTTGGTIRSDLPGTVDERGDTVTLDGSGPMIEAETASGEIVVVRGSLGDGSR